MKYENLEEEYNRIFTEKVMPFVREKIPRNFYSAPVYHLLDGLKINRFRSALPIIIAREYKVNEDFVLPLSMLCELTFTTAMAQDDYYDDDKSREGLDAAHIKFGVKETLLSCDYVNHIVISILNDLALDNLPESRRNLLIKLVNEGMKSWYLSVMMEFDSKKDLFSVNEEYLETLYLSKTVHGRMLLECAFLITQDDEKISEIIKQYSKHLALAGQLKNDIYDFTKHREYRGLSDLRQGHITWPLYLLIKSLNKKEKRVFLTDLDSKNYDKLIQMFRDRKVIEQTLGLIDFHVLAAKKCIKNKLPINIESILETWAEGNRHFSREPKI